MIKSLIIILLSNVIAGELNSANLFENSNRVPEANEVFATFPRNKIEHLNSEGYKMNEDELDGKAVRLVAAWNTKDSDVDQLLEVLKKSN